MLYLLSLIFLFVLSIYKLFGVKTLFFAGKFGDIASLSTARPKIFCNTGSDSIDVLTDMKSNVAF